MITAAIHQLAVSEAARLKVDARWVLGIIEVESSGEPDAWNPEPRYRYLWDIKRGRPFRALTPAESASEVPPADFPAPRGIHADAEWWGQQASWGLMQLMGAVARELGFSGRHMPGICDPATNIGLGCKWLAKLLARHGNVDSALASYNAGSPKLDDPLVRAYVDKVVDAGCTWPLA